VVVDPTSPLRAAPLDSMRTVTIHAHVSALGLEGTTTTAERPDRRELRSSARPDPEGCPARPAGTSTSGKLLMLG
jgi:hypothetical protein